MKTKNTNNQQSISSVELVAIKQRINDSKVLALDHRLPSRQAQQHYRVQFRGHVEAFLKAQLSQMPSSSKLSKRQLLAERTIPQAKASKPMGSLHAVAQMKSMVIERLNGVVTQRIRNLEITLPFGARVLGTPYDEEWHKRGNTEFGTPGFSMDRFTGNARTMFPGDGFSADALGLYLSSTESVLAVITPVGMYDFVWASFDNYPSLRSSGGLGITIYVDGKEPPLESRRAVLWNLSGVRQFTSDKGSGAIADAASPAPPGSFTFPLAPVFLSMNPGSQYLVWFWSWQVNQATSDTGFISSVKLEMPFVAIDVHPSTIIR